MNPTRIPNASDENSILITAEFFEDGHRLRADRTRAHRYELDLIVPDDITLDQLLEAVHEGICGQLARRYQVDPYDLDANPAYLDTIRRFEQMQYRAEQLPREFFRARRLRKPLHFRHHAAITAMDRYNAQNAPEEPAPGEEDLWRWLVCWDVFCCCHDQYLKGYPELVRDQVRIAFKQKAYPKHPVIACGSISSRSWSDESMRSLAKHTQIWLQEERHGSMTLRELGFLTSSRLIFDPNSHHSATPWFDALELTVPVEEQFPLYNSSERSDVQTASTDVRIDDPGSVRRPPVQSFFLLLGALLAGAAFFLPAAALAAFLGPLEAELSVGTLCCGILLALAATWASFRKLSSTRNRQWYRHYELYIRELLHRLRIIQQENTSFLLERYPPAYSLEDGNDLVERTFRVDGSISGRRPDQQDFLHVRIGLSQEGSHTARALVRFHLPEHNENFSAIRYKNIRSIRSLPFRIVPPESPEEEMAFNDGTVGFLNSLAEDIRDTYTWLDHAPVLMDLHHARAMGVCFLDSACSFYPLLNNMLLDLCFHHSPEDVQFVMFCPPISGLRKQQEYIRQFKQLPHFQKLLRDQSQFVFDPYYAAKVMDQIHRMHTLRQTAPEIAPRCHIVLLLLEDHGFRRHHLSKLLPSSAKEIETDDNNISFLFFTHSEAQLPPYCSHVLQLDSNRNCCYIPYAHRFRPGAMRTVPQTTARYGIMPDGWASCFLFPGAASDHDRMYQSFKILSALRQMDMTQTLLPRQLDLLRLLELSYPDLPTENWFHAPEQGDPAEWQQVITRRIENFIRSQWSTTDRRTELQFPIGISSHRPVWVDLDQTRNLLLASDPGMGKTESLVTCLTSLCMHHSPDSVRLFLIDPRTAGIIARLKGWDHVALTLDSGAPGGLSAALLQMCRELRDEVQRRRTDLNLMGVSDINAFNRALTALDSHIREQLKLDPVQDQQLIDRLRLLKRMPRLILAADHADQITAQLRFDNAEQSAYQELRWLLENGADFGIHLLLAAPRPEAFLPHELWPLFQGRLCLKTDNAQLSERILGSKLAAAPSMPGAGRAYLRSELTGEMDYVQIALCRNEIRAGQAAPFRITLMAPDGPHLLFYDSEGTVPAPPHIPPRPRSTSGPSPSGGSSSGQGKSRQERSGPHNRRRKDASEAKKRRKSSTRPENQRKIPNDRIGQDDQWTECPTFGGHAVPDDYVPGSDFSDDFSGTGIPHTTVPNDTVPERGDGTRKIPDDVLPD